jgi:CheY-like chemotaxis protein
MANLLSNALKFTFKGGITLEIFPENHRIYRFTIADTGVGIKDEDKGKLFKEFGKLDMGKDNTMNSQGVGLGLMISNQLALMLGPKIFKGTTLGHLEEKGIWFESEYQKGTKFHFRIADQNEAKSDQAATKVISATIPTEGEAIKDYGTYKKSSYFGWRGSTLTSTAENICKCPMVLVADDDGFNLSAMEAIFGSLKISVVSVYNGAEVLEEVKNRMKNPCSSDCKPFSIIFLDMNMAIMDGYTTAENLQAMFQDNPNLRCPIVGCSGNSQPTEIQAALDAGADDYCVKPINKNTINELCKKYMVGI